MLVAMHVVCKRRGQSAGVPDSLRGALSGEDWHASCFVVRTELCAGAPWMDRPSQALREYRQYAREYMARWTQEPCAAAMQRKEKLRW
jgi:hypothetical protein